MRNDLAQNELTTRNPSANNRNPVFKPKALAGAMSGQKPSDVRSMGSDGDRANKPPGAASHNITEATAMEGN